MLKIEKNKLIIIFIFLNKKYFLKKSYTKHLIIIIIAGATPCDADARPMYL
jgi:hypothetical protein